MRLCLSFYCLIGPLSQVHARLSSCTSSKDCGPGEICDATDKECRADIPPRSPKLCFPCKTNADCGGAGHICYGPKGNGRCTQPCGAGEFCPRGFACRSLYPGLAKQCVPENGTCRVPCLLDSYCPQGFTCQNKYCVRKGGGSHGDTCDPAPCKAGLSCVTTANGKICMQACGIKPGYAGTNCPANGTCLGGTRCYRNQSLQLCLASCQTTADCNARGGGTCSGLKNCLCRRQSDCNAGYVCNLFTYQGGSAIGACVPTTGNRFCQQGFECRSFNSGRFCVAKGSGNRSLGQNCDSLNRCKEGLVCLYTQSGQICFEDCTKNRKCDLGGRCLNYSNSLAVCLCSGTDCPKGRSCHKVLQGSRETYGYCGAQTPRGKGDCLESKECPPDYTCKEGKCVYKAPPKPEAKPEPKPEPATEAVQDGGTADAAQPEAKPEPTKEESPEPKAEAKPEPKAEAEKAGNADAGPIVDQPKATGGCGCNTSSALSDTEAPLFSFALLSFFLLLANRRRFFR